MQDSRQIKRVWRAFAGAKANCDDGEVADFFVLIVYRGSRPNTACTSKRKVLMAFRESEKSATTEQGLDPYAKSLACPSNLGRFYNGSS